jgi:DNA-binding transcriptional LysR family regulator
VHLTAAGERLVPRARSVLAELALAENEIRLVSAGLIGRVSIGFVGTATYELLPRVARSVREQLPGVALELFGERLSPALVDDLVARRLDIAMVRDPVPDAAVTLRPVRSERFVAALPADHALARETSVALADLRDSTFVTHPSGHRSVMYDAVMQACRSVGYLPSQIVEVRETATLVAFVAAGIGVALVPEPVRALALEGVVFRPLADVDQYTELVLATRTDDHSAAVANVVSVIEALTTADE